MSKALFLLVQRARVLATEEYLSAMPWHILDQSICWKVAIGTICGGPKVVGVVAEAYPTWHCQTLLVTDGDRTRTLKLRRQGTMLGFIIGTLDTMFRGGVYSGDLANLPEPVIAIGCAPGRDMKLPTN